MTELCFVDVETTGLDPHLHTIFEIALVKEEQQLVAWVELTPKELGHADSGALRVNNYYTRLTGVFPNWMREVHSDKDSRNLLAEDIVIFTSGCLLAGNNPKFDQQFLEAWMRRYGPFPPAWGHRVLDVPRFAAGYLQALGCGVPPPFQTSKVSDTLGISEPEPAHTALGDALWSKSIYEAVMSGVDPRITQEAWSATETDSSPESQAFGKTLAQEDVGSTSVGAQTH